jgi:hypothetical protein
MFDVLDTIKAGADQTGNSFALVETINSQGMGPPLHVHDRFDRGLYVLEGEYTVVAARKGGPYRKPCPVCSGRKILAG